MAVYLEEVGGLKCYRSPLFKAFPEVVHGFFTRRGGVSSAPYSQLNLSFSVGDLPEKVAANRRLVQQALGLDSLAGAAQVHGRREAVITNAPQNPVPEIPEVDILLTSRPGLGLLVKQADCQAVMFYDPVHRVVANVHCGWRGQIQNILSEAVACLKERFGSNPSDLWAAIGPSLGPCCAEFRNFRQEFPPHLWTYQVRPTYFDLWGYSRDQLAAAGLKPEHIEVTGLCSRCRGDEFFSYRREGLTGRQGAVIALRQ